ncbi:MAG: hypothetical protein NG712_02225 [Omnitrophica bacterium]|nr:hypothetical protein [Candidatus Omnitrophota bacterium]
MKALTTALFIGVAVVVLLFSVTGCGAFVARTQPDVGIYGGEPVIYPYSIRALKAICVEVLGQQDYLIVSEEAKEIRAVRHKKAWKHFQGSDMTITFKQLRANSTRIDIVSQTGPGNLTFNLQNKYIKDFLRALREKILPEPVLPSSEKKK